MQSIKPRADVFTLLRNYQIGLFDIRTTDDQLMLQTMESEWRGIPFDQQDYILNYLVNHHLTNIEPGKTTVGWEPLPPLSFYARHTGYKPDTKPNQVSTNTVAHPPHYNSGKIEVIEAIEDWNLGPHRANALKYIARAGRKDPAKEVEDLEKAIWYLQREVELTRAKKEGRAPKRPNDMVKR